MEKIELMKSLSKDVMLSCFGDNGLKVPLRLGSMCQSQGQRKLSTYPFRVGLTSCHSTIELNILLNSFFSEKVANYSLGQRVRKEGKHC